MREQKPEAQKLTKPTKTKTHSLAPTDILIKSITLLSFATTIQWT